MKHKPFYILISCLLIFSCSDSKNNTNNADKKYGDWNFLQIKSSAIGGTWHACGSAWANLICSRSGYVAANSVSPGLEFETMEKLKEGKVDIGLQGPVWLIWHTGWGILEETCQRIKSLICNTARCFKFYCIQGFRIEFNKESERKNNCNIF